jgi:hypothetical protein
LENFVAESKGISKHLIIADAKNIRQDNLNAETVLLATSTLFFDKPVEIKII